MHLDHVAAPRSLRSNKAWLEIGIVLLSILHVNLVISVYSLALTRSPLARTCPQ